MLSEEFISKLRSNGILADSRTFIKKGVHLMCEAPVSITGTQFFYPMFVGRCTYIKDGYVASLSSIGRFCSIGQNLRVGEGMHPTDWLSSHPFQYGAAGWFNFWPEYREFVPEASLPREVVKSPPAIGNDVWIGADVVIMRGVTIGDGAVIGAGAVVTKDVEPYAIVGGIPAKVIRKRFPDEAIERLRRIRWWDFEMKSLQGVPFNDIAPALDVLEERMSSGSLERWNPRRVKITAETIDEILFET